MEEDGIEAVLAKAIDLRLKIGNCIHKASTNNVMSNSQKSQSIYQEDEDKDEAKDKDRGREDVEKGRNGKSLSETEEEEDGEEDAERLLHIKDALEALEHQLNNLQALQQQQRYEREVALSDIEHSRKVLVDKLKEYKGEDLEVIQEASVFAGETVEHNNDLLLPPYPTRPPPALVVDNHFLSHFPSTRKSARNGVISGENKNLSEPESNRPQAMSKNSSKGLGCLTSTAAKTIFTIVGVITVLSLSGVGPTLRKRSAPFNILGFFRQSTTQDKREIVQCPPGKFLLFEDGEARCVVKERVAVPFESVAAKPDVNYGCG